MIHSIAVGCAGLALFGCAPAVAAQIPTRDWSPAERAVLGDFTVINAVAAASDRVFVVSPSSLAVWRPDYRRWEGPYQPREPRLLRDVFAAIVDPLDNSVWLARPGGWVHYEPDLDLWSAGTASARVQGLAFDLESAVSGVLLQTAAGWMQVPRGGVMAVPVPAPAQPVRGGSVQELLRSNPSLQASGARFLLDGRLRAARITSVARSFDRVGWYVGTSGVGLLYLREGAGIPDPIPFGIAGDNLGAVFAAPGGVWVASDRAGDAPAALSFVASDLSDFHSLLGPPATGLPFTQVRRLLGMGSSLWAATDYGVARIDPASGRVELIDDRRGLPDSRIYAIAARRGWIAVGTAHGAARITDSAEVIRIAPSFSDPAYAVAIAGDTTWLGTASGLFFTLSRDGELVQPAALGRSPVAREPVVALAWLGEILVALTEDRIMARRPNGTWSFGPVLSTQVGRLRALAPDDGGVWVAGERGVGFARLDLPIVRPLLPGDLPGEPRDVAVDADYIWIATSAGLVRFARDAVRP